MGYWKLMSKGLFFCYGVTISVENIKRGLSPLHQLFHRIIESFGSERTPRGHLVQPPLSEQGHR